MDKKSQNNIEKDNYHTFLENIDLDNIFLESSKANFYRHVNIDDLVYKLDTESGYGFPENMEHKSFIMKRKYILKAKKKRLRSFKIEAEYVLLFNYKDKIDQKCLDIYIERNLTLNVYPLFREFVQNIK